MAPNEKPNAEALKGIFENILTLYLTRIAGLRKVAIKKGATPEAIEKAELHVAIAKRKAENLGYGEQWAEAVAKVTRDTASIEEDEGVEKTRALLDAVALTSSVSGCQ
ncbi:hypothetical protein LTS10_011211 [Elasticomyces elasticus]|nr:hypothetical protein LTS10_011211 [Elasticomyces elasticus]